MIYFMNEDEKVITSKTISGLAGLRRKVSEGSLDELDITIPVSKLGKSKKKKEEENYVYLEGVSNGLFQIVNKSTDDKSLSYKAINIITHEITGLGLTKHKEFNNKTLGEIVKYIFRGSKYSLDEKRNIKLLEKNIESYKVETGDKGEQIKRLEDELFEVGFLINYEVELLENKREGKLNLNKHYLDRKVIIEPRASEVVKVRDYSTGKNIIKYDLTEDLTSKYDAIAPTGDEDEDTGKVLTIEDVVWSKSKGDKLDKPKGKDHISYRERPKRIKTVNYSGEKDPENLIILAYNELIEEFKTKENIKLTVYDKEEIEVGKYVEVEFNRDDIGEYIKRVKVLSISKDYAQPNVIELELGEGLHKRMGERLKELETGSVDEDSIVKKVVKELESDKETVIVGEKMSQTLKPRDVTFQLGYFGTVYHTWSNPSNMYRYTKEFYTLDGKGLEGQNKASTVKGERQDLTFSGFYIDGNTAPSVITVNGEDMGISNRVFKLKMGYKINGGYSITRVIVTMTGTTVSDTLGGLNRPIITPVGTVLVDENVSGSSGELEFILNESENYSGLGTSSGVNRMFIYVYINKKEGDYLELPLSYVDASKSYLDSKKEDLTGYLENVRIDKYMVKP